MPGIQGGTICFDIKYTPAVLGMGQTATFVFVEKRICSAAVFFKDQFPDAICYKADRVIIYGNMGSFVQGFLRFLVGRLILSPVSTTEHKIQRHFKRKTGNTQYLVKGYNVVGIFKFRQSPF